MLEKNLRYLRKKAGYTQSYVANYIGGVSTAAVSLYETGGNVPRQDKLNALAALYNVSIDDLLNVDLEQRDHDFRTAPASPNSIRVKVFSSIHAGIPIEAIEDVCDFEDIPKEWAAGGREYFGLKVRGDCMAPDYVEGDTIIVRKQSSCETGQDAVVYVDGYDAELKRVTIRPDEIILQALNPAYPPRVYSGADMNKIKIAGVVVELRRKK